MSDIDPDQVLTQSQVRGLFDYHPDTGKLFWKVSRGRVKAGAVAGYLQKNGYMRVKIGGVQHYAHRLIWMYINGCWPRDQIDHINQNPSDNRLENLRETTQAENMRNLPLMADNVSGVCVVRWLKSRNKWYAQISVNSKTIYLGSFANKEDAIRSRKSAEERYGFHENHGKGTRQ